MTSPDGLPSARDLVAQIRETGFSCTGCGACCRGSPDDSGLVYASTREVQALVDSGAGPWEEVAGPYPDFTPLGGGSSVTFGWCLGQAEGRCRFLTPAGCTAYAARPFICRTYPFSLADGRLVVSDCPGLGSPISPGAALTLAADLLARARHEAEEEERVREILGRGAVPGGKRCVVDGSGVRVLHG